MEAFGYVTKIEINSHLVIGVVAQQCIIRASLGVCGRENYEIDDIVRVRFNERSKMATSVKLLVRRSIFWMEGKIERVEQNGQWVKYHVRISQLPANAGNQSVIMEKTTFFNEKVLEESGLRKDALSVGQVVQLQAIRHACAELAIQNITDEFVFRGDGKWVVKKVELRTSDYDSHPPPPYDSHSPPLVAVPRSNGGIMRQNNSQLSNSTIRSSAVTTQPMKESILYNNDNGYAARGNQQAPSQYEPQASNQRRTTRTSSPPSAPATIVTNSKLARQYGRLQESLPLRTVVVRVISVSNPTKLVVKGQDGRFNVDRQLLEPDQLYAIDDELEVDVCGLSPTASHLSSTFNVASATGGRRESLDLDVRAVRFLGTPTRRRFFAEVTRINPGAALVFGRLLCMDRGHGDGDEVYILLDKVQPVEDRNRLKEGDTCQVIAIKFHHDAVSDREQERWFAQSCLLLGSRFNLRDWRLGVASKTQE